MEFALERKFHFVGFHTMEEFNRVYGMDMKAPTLHMYKEVLVKLFSNEGYNLEQEITNLTDDGGISFNRSDGSGLKIGSVSMYRVDGDPDGLLQLTVSGKYSLRLDGDSKEKMTDFYGKFDGVGDGIGKVLTNKFLPKSRSDQRASN